VLEWAALLIAFPAAMWGVRKPPRPQKVAGLLAELQPSTLTVRDAAGKAISMRTLEDFTEQVAVGSKVIAWYYPKEDGNVLKWLQYPLENFFIPARDIRARVSKIAILPSSDVPHAEQLFEVMGRYLKTKLKWYVAPTILSAEVMRRLNRNEAAHSTLAAVDPATGDFDFARYREVHHHLIRNLAEAARVNAVLEASVERVKAPIDGRTAQWDGVTQPVAGKVANLLTLITPLPAKGEVPAATVVLKLRDGQANLLWSNRRGFTVLAALEGMGNSFRDRSIEEALQDTGSVQKWLAMVFESLLAPQELRAAAADR